MELHRGNGTGVHRYRLLAGLVCLVLAGGLLLTEGVAGADDRSGVPTVASGRAGIIVVQVKGLIDPVNVSLVRDAVRDANERHLTMVILQIDSPGAVSDVTPARHAIERSGVPVIAWVGPSGAEAKGGAGLLALAAHKLYVSQGSDIGPVTPARLDDPARVSTASVVAQLRRFASATDRDESSTVALAHSSRDAETGAHDGATNGVRPTVGELIVQLDGKTVSTAAGEVELSTAKVVGKGQARRRQANQEVVFTGLDLGAQIAHGLISPSMAYFLLVAGLALVVFEFFAASVGFAAAVGALALVGAGFGFSHLAVHWWAVALLVVSMLGFSIDAQSGGLGFWTAVGVITLVVGSLELYGGDGSLRPRWWLLLLVVLGIVLFYGFALPAFIRARFSTPTIGREGMVGEMGEAEVAIAPDGVVMIRGARWRARTNRATPIGAGEAARVVSVEGLVLEVEPEVGGARDHRERARRAKVDQGDAPETGPEPISPS